MARQAGFISGSAVLAVRALKVRLVTLDVVERVLVKSQEFGRVLPE